MIVLMKPIKVYVRKVVRKCRQTKTNGEQEAEWLASAGLEPLAAPFRAGRELPDTDLERALRLLPRHQAEAVRRRVRSLNHTVRQRGRRRQRKPDIRDVFRDLENSSTGTRSRSATPDSLDSELPCSGEDGGPSTPSWLLFPSGSPANGSPPTPHWASESTASLGRGSPPTPPPSFVQIFHPANMPAGCDDHKTVRRLPSAPASALPVHELFRGAFRGSFHGGDIVASDCAEGIEMLNYQRIGSMHLSKSRTRGRITDSFDDRTPDHNLSSSAPSSNHDLTADIENNNKNNNTSLRRNVLIPHASITRSQSSVYERERDARDAQRDARRVRSQGHLSFEEVCRQRGTLESPIVAAPNAPNQECPESGRTWMEFLSEGDQQILYPLLLLEVTALFDSCGLSFSKRKPSKRKRKEEGNIFGVSLATLLDRDRQLSSEHSLVPLFVQKLVNHLEKRGLSEEGVLRVAAHRLKVETLTVQLENNFYTRPDQADNILECASAHELAALLKKWLRDLPHPLLTPELVALFYRTHEVPTNLRARALNLLVLLLPTENRATLKVLIDFLNRVVKNQEINKMSLHNVAMIAAPSLFPPRYVESAAAASSGSDKTSLSSQVSLAAVCCQVSEALLRAGEPLWVVPPALIGQVRRLNEEDRQRRQAKENKPMKRLLGRRNASNPSSKVASPSTSASPVGLDASGALRVNAPQFGLTDFPVAVAEGTTAGGVVLCLVEEVAQDPDAALCRPAAIGRGDRNAQRRPNSMYSHAGNGGGHGRGGGVLQLAHNANLSCFIATADPELALRTHFLYEVGGNIGERQLEQSAMITAVLKDNPGAAWVLRCHHRNGNNPLPGVSPSNSS